MTTEEYIELKRKYHKDGSGKMLRKLKEFNRELLRQYPWLTPFNAWSGIKLTHIPDFEYDYEFTIMDDMPDGWRFAFGDEMCKEIDDELKKYNYVDKYKVVQVKEKYGSLCWYTNGAPIGKLSDVDRIILSPDKNLPPYDHYKDYYYYSGIDEKTGFRKYEHRAVLEKCKLFDIEAKYEKMSETTCIVCGKEAKWISTGWISPFCDDHINKKLKYVSIKEYFKED